MYQLLLIEKENGNLVTGSHIQWCSGKTLEEASAMARETERANSFRINVAVVDNGYDAYSLGRTYTDVVRLDRHASKGEPLYETDENCSTSAVNEKIRVDAKGIITYVAPNKEIVKLMEGDDVQMSIRNLFFKANPIAIGHVVREEGNEFVLYNEDNEIACFNGETCRIYQVGSKLITFANLNGDGTIFFTLTLKEAETALFPTDYICD